MIKLTTWQEFYDLEGDYKICLTTDDQEIFAKVKSRIEDVIRSEYETDGS